MVADGSGRDLPFWRERILRAVLVTTSWLGGVAYVPSVYLSLRQQLWSIAIADTVVWGVVLFLTLTPGLSHRVRARSLVVLVYGLGMLLVAYVGISGAGLAWLTAMPVFAAILLGQRAALAGLALSALAMGASCAGVAAGWIVFAPPPTWQDGGLAVLVVNSANGLLLSAAMALAVSALLRGLEESQRSLRQEMTERTQAFAEREQLQEQLRSAQKLEAVGHLASGIAHDFNNLLVPILANADELRRGVEAGTPEGRALADIVLSAERGRSLVQRVVRFGGKGATEPQDVCVADVLHDATRLLRAGLPATTAIECKVEDDDGTVRADPIEVHQVLMNLGANAAYAVRGRGGLVTFSLTRSPDGAHLVLRVRDDGSGMTEEARQRAFEPFFTTKPTGEGSGLGLATVHAIVTGMGGQVTIDSAPHRGTQVTVRMPRSGTMARHPRSADTVEAGATAASGGLRVLLVDDEPLVLRVCEAMLQRLGHDVVAVGDAQHAATLLESTETRIDVLLTDKSMPGMTGLALAALARRVRPSLPIVMATGFLDEWSQVEADGLGLATIIQKPYRASDLETALTHAVPVPPPR